VPKIGDVVDKIYKPIYELLIRKRIGTRPKSVKENTELNSRGRSRRQICREARDWMLRGHCIM
jgi:hypothetical protein